MELRYSKGSPFARKVRIAAHEIGISSQIRLVLTNAQRDVDSLELLNPLGKIPVLTTDDGEVLFDSAVICEYLDSRFGSNRLIPASGRARWEALRMAALGDGIAEAGSLFRAERMRSDVQVPSAWANQQYRKVRVGLSHVESMAATFGDAIHIGHVSLACAIGWLQFRLGAEAFLQTYPRCASWFNEVSRRESLRATVPSD
jgi:glutathione S-transferase